MYKSNVLFLCTVLVALCLVVYVEKTVSQVVNRAGAFAHILKNLTPEDMKDVPVIKLPTVTEEDKRKEIEKLAFPRPGAKDVRAQGSLVEDKNRASAGIDLRGETHEKVEVEKNQVNSEP